ncbi:ferrous iron transport protein B [Campylobacterota bacterium]|nr:ferrous iron transport protein B [Campylobacterota bacterium]
MNKVVSKLGEVRVALVGQPNVGKSSILNAISGSKVKVGNFAGVTVEKATASLRSGNTLISVTDLPGTYSLSAYSLEEKIARDFLEAKEYDLIVQVVESVNLERNLAFTAELMHINKPIVIALNMIDEAKKDGLEIDEKQLSAILGIPCIKVSARTSEGLSTLIARMADASKFEARNKLIYSDVIENAIDEVAIFLGSCGSNEREVFGGESVHDIARDLLFQKPSAHKRLHDTPLFVRLQPVLNKALEAIYVLYETRDMHDVVSAEHRAFAKGATLETVKRSKAPAKEELTDKIDRVLLHPVFGLPIFLFFMWSLFQITFTLGEIPMGWIEDAFGAVSDAVHTNIAQEEVAGLIADGVLGGVGAVLMFLPNIMILFLGIALLESTGYMARAAFLLDGFLHRFGLHGKSFVPLVSGFGCSVPAFMAARTLKNERDRLLTLFIIPFMSCGARLPVYILLIGAFLPVSQAGNALFGIYIFGALIGLLMAFLLRRLAFKGPDEPFVMEMPRYRMPSMMLLWTMVWSKALAYIKKAGTFILAVSVLVWFASNYPAIGEDEALASGGENAVLIADGEDAVLIADGETVEAVEAEADEEAAAALKQLENSYLGVTGKFIEPLFAPLDFDWRVSVSLVTGLAAKEVVVSTMGVLYSLGEVDEEDVGLREILAQALSPASAVALLMIVLFYNPCLAATVVFTQEAGRIKYAFYLFIFTSIVAYAMALIGFTITNAVI